MKRIVATAILLAASCATRGPSGPPEIRLGIDACEGCRMTISDARYAAAVDGEADGERRMLLFDDIGCLARWEARAGSFIPRHRWVHDRRTERWIDANAAVFVRSTEWATPMGSGLAAFSEAPEDVADTRFVGWERVLELARAGDLDTPAELQPAEGSR